MPAECALCRAGAPVAKKHRRRDARGAPAARDGRVAPCRPTELTLYQELRRKKKGRGAREFQRDNARHNLDARRGDYFGGF